MPGYAQLAMSTRVTCAEPSPSSRRTSWAVRSGTEQNRLAARPAGLDEARSAARYSPDRGKTTPDANRTLEAAVTAMAPHARPGLPTAPDSPYRMRYGEEATMTSRPCGHIGEVRGCGCRGPEQHLHDTPLNSSATARMVGGSTASLAGSPEMPPGGERQRGVDQAAQGMQRVAGFQAVGLGAGRAARR